MNCLEKPLKKIIIIPMGEISVILNVYNRYHTLEQQIESIKNQSIHIKSENIHIWYNKSDNEQKLPIDKDIKTYTCNWNTKFFGRFTLPLLIKTPYVALFDDDMFPNKDWLKNCLETINHSNTNGILGGTGIVLNSKKYESNTKYGWKTRAIHSDKTERVDLVSSVIFYLFNCNSIAFLALF